nr:hypothetical protein CFP56_19436 [Quercus suber]
MSNIRFAARRRGGMQRVRVMFDAASRAFRVRQVYCSIVAGSAPRLAQRLHRTVMCACRSGTQRFQHQFWSATIYRPPHHPGLVARNPAPVSEPPMDIWFSRWESRATRVLIRAQGWTRRAAAVNGGGAAASWISVVWDTLRTSESSAQTLRCHTPTGRDSENDTVTRGIRRLSLVFHFRHSQRFSPSPAVSASATLASAGVTPCAVAGSVIWSSPARLPPFEGVDPWRRPRHPALLSPLFSANHNAALHTVCALGLSGTASPRFVRHAAGDARAHFTCFKLHLRPHPCCRRGSAYFVRAVAGKDLLGKLVIEGEKNLFMQSVRLLRHPRGHEHLSTACRLSCEMHVGGTAR